MKVIALICMIVFSMHSSHDVPIAVFDFYVDTDGIDLEIVFDQESLEMEMGRKLNDSDSGILSAYFQERLTVITQTDPCTMYFVSDEKVGEHVKCTFRMNYEDEILNQLFISNNCFLETEDQSNIVRVFLDDNQRDFRMHRERTEIRVDF